MIPESVVSQGSTKVRWVVLALLFVVSFVAYLLRMNISVAAKFMMPELGISEIQMGWVFGAFVWGYALFQIPGGVFGEILGPRWGLSVVALLWAIVTVLTGGVPGQLLTWTGGALASLVVLRFLMGVVQAPLYPITAGTIQQWFPVGGWALPNGLSSMGLGLGAAFTPPLVAWVMVTVGWRETFYVTAPVVLVIIAIWWWFVTDSPEEHPKVGRRELELITAGRPEEESIPETGVLKRLSKNRDIWLLTLSYLCMNYVFYIFFTWFYIYLVDVRGFGLLEGGFFASLPFMVGSLAATAGGWTCDRLCRSIGPRWGCRLPGIVGMVLVAIFLVLGALATNAVAAVVLLSICFASTQFTEGAYWAGATYVGGRHTSAATGFLNTGGNLGGVISSPLIPVLVDHFGWLVALSTGSAFALVSALLWLWVRADQPLFAVAEGEEPSIHP
jgi:ACS family glucarate transporter-like MFS transporter